MAPDDEGDAASRAEAHPSDVVRLCPECADRYNVDTVGTRVGVLSARDDHESGWRRRPCCVHVGDEALERRCRLILARGCELDLDREPLTIPSFDDGIDFTPAAVAVVEDARVMGLGVDAQVTHDQRLEELTKVLKIAEEPLRIRADRGVADCGISREARDRLRQVGERGKFK